MQTGVSVEIDLCGEKLFSNGTTATTVLAAITQQQTQSNNGSTAVWFDPAWATLGDRYSPRTLTTYWVWLLL